MSIKLVTLHILSFWIVFWWIGPMPSIDFWLPGFWPWPAGCLWTVKGTGLTQWPLGLDTPFAQYRVGGSTHTFSQDRVFLGKGRPGSSDAALLLGEEASCPAWVSCATHLDLRWQRTRRNSRHATKSTVTGMETAAGKRAEWAGFLLKVPAFPSLKILCSLRFCREIQMSSQPAHSY